jgi:hypothetical protein
MYACIIKPFFIKKNTILVGSKVVRGGGGESELGDG